MADLLELWEGEEADHDQIGTCFRSRSLRCRGGAGRLYGPGAGALGHAVERVDVLGAHVVKGAEGAMVEHDRRGREGDWCARLLQRAALRIEE